MSATVWLEIGENRNKWIICNYYREHTLIGTPGSNIMENQIQRLNQFLESIETVPCNRNLVIMGDFNINLTEDGITHNNNELKEMLLDRLPLVGLTQTVRNNTRHCSNSTSSLTKVLACIYFR